jgi:hypothetical protein
VTRLRSCLAARWTLLAAGHTLRLTSGTPQATLDRAHAQNSERFSRRPKPPRLPEQAWINHPALKPAQ